MLKKKLALVLGVFLLIAMLPSMAAAAPSGVEGMGVVTPEGVSLDDAYLQQISGDFGPVKLSDGGPGGGIVYPLNPSFVDDMFTAVGKAATSVVKATVRAAKAVDRFLDRTVGKFVKYFGYYELYRELRGGSDN